MADNSNKNDWEELAKKFKVTREECEQCFQFNEKIFRPRYEKSFLAATISVVEGLINEKLREDTRKPDGDGGTPVFPLYKIMLSGKMSRKNVKAFIRTFPNGTVIEYDTNGNEKEIYNTIMHALGHLLLQYGVLAGVPHTENIVELFIHFVSDGIND